jgi:hypothetical protein
MNIIYNITIFSEATTTADETWVYQYDQKTEHPNVWWKKLVFEPRKKGKCPNHADIFLNQRNQPFKIC